MTKTHTQYTPNQKIEVLKTLERINCVKETARLHNIKSPKTIREWRKDKEKIKELDRQNMCAKNDRHRKRLFGGGRKPKLRHVEEELQSTAQSIDQSTIQLTAQSIDQSTIQSTDQLTRSLTSVSSLEHYQHLNIWDN